MTKTEYERLYPDAQPITSIMNQGIGDQSLSMWITQETIRIAEYFYYEIKKETLNLYPGNVAYFKGTPEDKQMQMKTRTTKKNKILCRVSRSTMLASLQEL